MPSAATPLGILAGAGSLPREIADHAAAAGRPVMIVALGGEADDAFAPHPHKIVRWGQVGGLLAALRAAQCRDLVIVGGVRRPDMTRIRTDLGFFKALPAVWRIMRSGGDDGVLRGVVRFFEGEGFNVVGPAEAAPPLVIGPGTLVGAASRNGVAADIAKGFEIVARLGAFDIGQGAIVRDGVLEALEGAEGTDRMLARVAAARAGRTIGGVLVKRPKPGQEMRVDMPVIGPRTIEGAAKAGLAGIAVEAGRVLIAERERTIAEAKAAGLFITGVDSGTGEAIAAPPRVALRVRGDDPNLPHLAAADAVLGAQILSALAPFGAGGAVIVMDRYVLAVETGEGVEAALLRAASIRPWGRRLVNKRRGAIALATGAAATRDVATQAAGAGLAALVTLGDIADAAAHEAARAAKLVIAVAEVGGTRGAP